MSRYSRRSERVRRAALERGNGNGPCCSVSCGRAASMDWGLGGFRIYDIGRNATPREFVLLRHGQAAGLCKPGIPHRLG